MTREEARIRADELNHAAPDGAQEHWTIRDGGGEDWEVVRVTVPGMRFRSGALHTATEQRPKPDEPPDPRPSIVRLIPPYGPG
ncbi:MAG: hypothetical protein ABSH51_04620 [Solirubrobacteraceae bacterium]|jgi:hypothetical protein